MRRLALFSLVYIGFCSAFLPPPPSHGAIHRGWDGAPLNRARVATSAEALSSLTVPELKARCREQGLLVGGKKADLIARLSEANSLVAKAGGSGSSSPALVKVHTYTWDPTDTSKAGAAALSPKRYGV